MDISLPLLSVQVILDHKLINAGELDGTVGKENIVAWMDFLQPNHDRGRYPGEADDEREFSPFPKPDKLRFTSIDIQKNLE